MIVCGCTGATDRDVSRGFGGRGRRLTGTCGGCGPLVRELRAALRSGRCNVCGGGSWSTVRGESMCMTCAWWSARLLGEI